MIPKTPRLTVNPSNAVIESGTSVTLECVTESTGAVAAYNFLKDDQAVFSESDGFHTMDSVSTADSSSYTCTVVMNSVTSLPSDDHSITVVGEGH